MNSRARWSKVTEMDGAAALSAANLRLPPLISLLLVLLVAWQSAKIAWMLVPAPAAGEHVTLPSSLPRTALQSGSSGDVIAIAAAHIFGVADAENEVPTVVTEPDDDLADTRLANLVLKGTVASAQPEFSVALISDGNNEQQVFAVGDAISSRASLHAVYADRVILNENGDYTNLRLPREYASAAANTVRRRTTATRQSPGKNSIQNIVSQNLTKLTDVIRPTPYMQNGQPAGYRVYPGRDRKQFAALGLRPGDIIKDIDGQSLTDPTQAMKIFQSLGTAEQVTVTIERGGQAETLVLKTSQLELGGGQNK